MKFLKFALTLLILGCTTRENLDLMENPKILLKEDLILSELSVNGIKIGDSSNKIPKHLISEKHLRKFIFLKDGSRYLIEKEKVIALGIPAAKTQLLGINNFSDINKLFGKEDQLNAIEIGDGKIGIYQFHFEDKKMTLNWDDKHKKVAHLFIGRKVLVK